MSDEAIRQAVAYWRDETSLLLNQPRVWAGVTRVASALLRRGHLSPRAVKKYLVILSLTGSRIIPQRVSNVTCRA